MIRKLIKKWLAPMVAEIIAEEKDKNLQNELRNIKPSESECLERVLQECLTKVLYPTPQNVS